MDPLSVTLAVITLATAVKDIVELAQKIHGSFANVSNNLRKTQRVAKDVAEMVEKIKVFYEENQEKLDNMESFRVALLGLLDKLRGFETSMLPLLPKTGKRRLGFFVRGWWNNSKIEGHILDLQSDIVQVMLEYMMKSTMRAEVKLETIHHDTNTGFVDMHNDMAQGFEGIRRDISTLHIATPVATITHSLYKSSGIASDEFNRNIVMFANSTPSTSAPMLCTPNVITEEVATSAYIKFQINSIAMIVEKISVPLASAPNGGATYQLTLVFEQASMSIARLRHHVVRQVTGIRDLLDTEPMETDCIHESASALNKLATGLAFLDMGHEAILVRKWATILARTVVDASVGEQPDLGATLARYLLLQSICYQNNGDVVKCFKPIEEAYTITQYLRNQYGGEAHFLILRSRILFQYAQFVDNHQSIRVTIEGIRILEGLFNVQAFTQAQLHGHVVWVVTVPPNSPFFDCIFSSAQPITAITSYAHALQFLATYLLIDGYPQTASDLACLAITVHRKIVSNHGPEHRVELANALSMLLQDEIANFIPTEDLVDMANECSELLRELAEKNPLCYARELVLVLWERASMLVDLDRDAEAISACEEAATLAGQIIQDTELYADALAKLSGQFRRLKRHDDAVRTGKLAITTYHDEAETRAERYFYLSRDLRHLRRYNESAEAARRSVTLYRHLATKDPKKWMGDLTEGLSDLAHCLAASGDNSEALIVWKDSVRMLDHFLKITDASSNVINKYLEALDTHSRISYAPVDEGECLEICNVTVHYLHQLAEIYPENEEIYWSLLCTEFRYAHNMFRVGRLQDAQEYIDHLLDIWISKPEAISGPNIAEWHALMVTLKADVLDIQGYTKEALLSTRKVHDILRPSITANGASHFFLINSMVKEARLQVNTGNSGEALQVAEEALQLARDNKPEPIVESMVWSLHAVAFTTLFCRDYERAAQAAQEGCNISSGSNWRNSAEEEYNLFLRPSLFAVLSSAEANLGRCGTALEYANRAVDESLDLSNNKFSISATTANQSYMETRGNLADILLATGDLAQARQICEERIAYFSERTEKRIGDYRELGPILRMLGLLCCNEGRHDEGNAAAKELSRIVKMLEITFPSLHEQVKIRLRHQVKVPILMVLNDIGQKLDCKHQIEVMSLFGE